MIRNFLTVIFSFFLVSFSFSIKEYNRYAEIRLVSSTPGGKEIKSVLGIAPKDSIDFIRWNILLDSSTGIFKANLQYGISKPNTNGFIDPRTKTIEGTFNVNSSVYVLKSNALQTDLKFIKISDHLFHLLGTDKKLLVGNGGWSYVLNNISPGEKLSELKSLENDIDFFGKQDSLIIFEGRTPCDQMPNEFIFNVSKECIKLKWQLKLIPGFDSGKRGTYRMKGSISNHKELTGTFKIVEHEVSNKITMLLQLNPTNNTKQISFLIADKNILYFLNPGMKLFVGDSNFSYALNRIPG